MSKIKKIIYAKEKMRRMLLAAELRGVPQNTLVQKCRTFTKDNQTGVTCEDVRDILKDWSARNLVQCFSVRQGFSKKPTLIWRATEDLVHGRI